MKKSNYIGGNKKKVLSAIKIIVLFFVLILYMVPFILILTNSFKSRIAIIKHPLQLVDPKGFSISNYISAFKEMNYIRICF